MATDYSKAVAAKMVKLLFSGSAFLHADPRREAARGHRRHYVMSCVDDGESRALGSGYSRAEAIQAAVERHCEEQDLDVQEFVEGAAARALDRRAVKGVPGRRGVARAS